MKLLLPFIAKHTLNEKSDIVNTQLLLNQTVANNTKINFMKYFYRISILCFLIMNSFQMKAQFDNSKYEKETFLIGILNEYMGHQVTFTNGNDYYYQRVDIIAKHNLNRALFIDSLFSNDFPDIKIVKNEAPMGIKLYSAALSKKIDNYYNYKPSSISTAQGDKVYFGELIKEKFNSEKQINSFLLGCYTVYGEDTNSVNSNIKSFKKRNLIKEDYKIEENSLAFSMPNAPTKAILCATFLKQLGCKNVTYGYINTIPAGHFVIFKPSLIVLKIIDDAKRLRQYISSIDVSKVKFTLDGTKYIQQKPYKPKPIKHSTKPKPIAHSTKSKDSAVVVVGFNTKKDNTTRLILRSF